MKVYFSEADYSEIEQFGDEGVFVVETDSDTRYFYCGVEHGTNAGGVDEVRIFDGCNRSIPICIDAVPQLIEALMHCVNNHESFLEATRMQERIESDAVSFVENADGEYLYVEEV